MNAVVVASNRPENLEAFFDKWSKELKKARLYVVLDLPERRDFNVHGLDVKVFCWADIDSDLAERAWIIPRQTSAIKSYGIYKAWQDNPDMIAVLDDDCYPDTSDFLLGHWKNLHKVVHPRWYSTLKVPPNPYPRGYPYGIRAKLLPVGLSHGLWSGNADVDAVTALQLGKVRTILPQKTAIVPVGMYFPMCGMNVAFRREIAPVMYFGLQGASWPYDRYDDIWCGLFAKRCLDELGYSVVSGLPYIFHSKASDPYKNLQREERAMEVNERLWQYVDDVHVVARGVAKSYISLARGLQVPDEYFVKLTKAMEIWANLFSEGKEGGRNVAESSVNRTA